MKLMNKLSTLTLAAAMVPILALGTLAIAQEQDQSDFDLQVEKPGEGEIENPAEQVPRNEEGLIEQRLEEGTSEGLRFFEYRVEEAFMSEMPTGALYSNDVLGKLVINRQTGEILGETQELVIGEDGRILGVLVTTGGLLGLGGQSVSLKWDQLEHAMENDEVGFHTDMEKSTLRNAPKYGRN